MRQETARLHCVVAALISIACITGRSSAYVEAPQWGREVRRIFVPANDTSRVSIGGRHAWATAKDGSVVAAVDWPCVSFNATLASAGAATIVAVGVVMEGGHNDFLIFFDGLPASNNVSEWKLVTDDQLREYRLPPPRRTDAHTLDVSIIKITEASYFILKALLPLSRVQFYGFAVYVASPASTRLAEESYLLHKSQKAVSPRRRIEFFSDSDSNGFGIEGEDSWTCVLGLEKLENCWEGYAATASRWLDADYHIEAWSGKGVVKNAIDIGERSDDPMPLYWNRSIATQPNALWRFSRWIPDLIVILLGTNDYFAWPYPSDSEFIRGYVEMARTILASYNFTTASGAPLNMIALCGGTTDNDRAPCPRVQEAVELINANSAKAGLLARAHYVDIPRDLLSYPADYGCLDHRNVVGQRKLAHFLVNRTKLIMGW